MTGIVAVLDAAVLVPPGLRDLLLSVAEAGFRPLWQDEIEVEVRRNGIRLQLRRGATPEDAAATVDRALAAMNVAFEDAKLATRLWAPIVGRMNNHPKDRHVLAAAVAGHATHVVTLNMKDFPVSSRPVGVAVQRPDAFLLDCLRAGSDMVVRAVTAMANRHRRPAHTARELAQMMADGRFVSRFGAELLAILGE